HLRASMLQFSTIAVWHAFSVVFLFFDSVFFFTATAPPVIYTLSLHDALPIWSGPRRASFAQTRARTSDRTRSPSRPGSPTDQTRSEEHTSELQSRFDLVCRLLLEKKKGRRKASQR